jgi:hypothetical protein
MRTSGHEAGAVAAKGVKRVVDHLRMLIESKWQIMMLLFDPDERLLWKMRL